LFIIRTIKLQVSLILIEMDQKENIVLKERVRKKAFQLGAVLTGFASVDRWHAIPRTEPVFFPQHIFPFSRTVIVLALPLQIPILDTTPSIAYSELYNTTNRLLDEIAYKLTVFLNSLGYRAVFFPRDGYGDISVLIRKPEAAFSHVLAGWYAGLGTIGYNHTLLTREFGPRVRLVSVITDAEISSDKMIEKDLCIRCELCRRCCPTQAFSTTDNLIADMDKHKCAVYHEELKKKYRYPCGVCIKVCPVGEDRNLYGKYNNKYLNEKRILNSDPGSPDYSSWEHIRGYGSE
jgi:epoxyqueuosine reductase